jgi:hypothetical protein
VFGLGSMRGVTPALVTDVMESVSTVLESSALRERGVWTRALQRRALSIPGGALIAWAFAAGLSVGSAHDFEAGVRAATIIPFQSGGVLVGAVGACVGLFTALALCVAAPALRTRTFAAVIGAFLVLAFAVGFGLEGSFAAGPSFALATFVLTIIALALTFFCVALLLDIVAHERRPR